jgi:hypothetical protein
MIIESQHESYAVSKYLNTGRRWYAAMDTFHVMTNDNNSTSTTSMTTENSMSTTTNNNNHPPTVSLFCNEDNNFGNNVLVQADMARTCMAIRVAHMNEQMKNQQEHFSLKNDLMNHLWQNWKKWQRSSNQNNDDVE